MSIDQDGFVKVAATSDVVDGKPKAVKVEGRSIALFQYDGKVFATDNQCPHMGYPLTRGRVRNGVLPCDWHGWSYDLSGAVDVLRVVVTIWIPFRLKNVMGMCMSMCAMAGRSGQTPISSC
jgi:nitrite reductase/ring-hydroxylating ferredoxin subunit